MPMPMWLSRQREFEQLDQAINDACCQGDLSKLQEWADDLGQVVAGTAPSGIGTKAGAFTGPQGAQAHWTQHWVGADNPTVPPQYWPYAWGKSPHPAEGRVRIDRLVSFGLQWSIRKVIAARQMGGTDPSNQPACNAPCRTHVTVWVCTEVSDTEKLLAAADLDFRKSLFRVGVIESRDAVVLVIKTPRPIDLMGDVCDGSKGHSGGTEQLFKEPVIATRGFTDGAEPKWTQSITGATTVRGSGTVGNVEDLLLPAGGGQHMPAGTYPEDSRLELCVSVPLPTNFDGESFATPSELIKEILRRATEPGRLSTEGLDLSPAIIDRLRITIED